MNKRRTWLLIALVLAAIGGCLTWLVKHPPKLDLDTRSTGDSNVAVPASGLSGCSSALPAPEQNTGDIIDNAATPDDGHDEDPAFPPSVLIRCIDAAGRPIEGMKLEYWGGQVRVSDRRGQATTDAEGNATFDLDGHGKVFFESVDEHWILKADFDSKARDRVFTAQVCVTLSVWAMTEDGAPWQGTVSVHGTDHYKYLRFDGLNESELARVPVGRDLKFVCFESMLGVEEQSIEVPAREIFDGQRLVLTLKQRLPITKGAIRLDFTNYAGTVIQIAVTLPGSELMCSGFEDYSNVPQNVRLSKPLRPGEYVVKIKGEPGWQSPVVTVNAAEIVDVVVTEYLPSTVTVTVYDETGNALSGAIFMLGASQWVGFDVPAGIPSGAAVTDSNGKATLGKLAPGRQRLLIEAEGFEPHELDLDLLEGESREEGPFYLKPATGLITLTLKGMAEGKKYTVMIVQPGGGVIRMIRDTTDAKIVLDKLPMRKYVVAVIAGKGGNVASSIVELTAESATSEIELDVSKLTGD